MYYVTFQPVLVPTVIESTKHIENVSSNLLCNPRYYKNDIILANLPKGHVSLCNHLESIIRCSPSVVRHKLSH